MKKLLTVLFVLGISLQSFAGLKEKDVIGSWKYKVVFEQTTLTGILKFEKKDGKLTGEVISDDGNTFPLTKVEIKEDNILYFELKPEYEVLSGDVSIEGKKFQGTVGNYNGVLPITGEKIE